MVALRHLREQASTVERRLDAPTEMIERIMVRRGKLFEKFPLTSFYKSSRCSGCSGCRGNMRGASPLTTIHDPAKLLRSIVVALLLTCVKEAMHQERSTWPQVSHHPTSLPSCSCTSARRRAQRQT